MKSRIKLSNEATDDLYIVKNRLKLGGQDDYIVARIAFGRSLQISGEPQIKRVFEGKAGDKRKEIQFSTLEQDHGVLMRALITQKYNRFLTGEEYQDLLEQHIEHGLWLIRTETETLSGYDYLSYIAQAVTGKNPTGNRTVDYVPNQSAINPSIINPYIGKDKKTQEAIYFPINIRNNPHFAIIGGSGSGKTYFLKHLLNEIRSQSKYKTNFIIFDYKDGDIATDEKFVKATRAKVIDVKKRPLPLNLFWDSIGDEREEKACAERIVNLVTNVEGKIGKVQEQNLYNAVVTAFEEHRPYPDFYIINDILDEITDGKADSLTSVLRPIVDQKYFVSNKQHKYENWTDETFIIDIHDIEKKDLICFFVLNQIHRELKKLGVAPVDKETNAKHIRTVIVIDEAHYFLSQPKRAKILQNMIRDVRSAGGAIILASQSPDDYDKADFDFLEQMEFPVVLKSTPKSHKFLEQKFGLETKNAKKLLSDLANLERGQAFISDNGVVKLVELCK